MTRDAGVGVVSDELVGLVVDAVRPARPNGHGRSWDLRLVHEQQIRAWIQGGEGRDPLSIVKVEELLAWQGVRVPYRTLHRFAVRVRVKTTTVRVADGQPGVECQVDFAQLGLLAELDSGRQRRGVCRSGPARLSRILDAGLKKVAHDEASQMAECLHRLGTS